MLIRVLRSGLVPTLPIKQIALSLIAILLCQPLAHAGRYDVAIKIVTGAAAVLGAANSAEATTIYQQKYDVVRDLKQHNLNPRDGAIFQIYFVVDPRAAHRWILNPNVYALVQIEGQGDFVPASITKGYRGQEISLTVYGKDVSPGGRILVNILDDKEFWNTAWNALLQSEISFQVAAKTVLPMVKTQFDASGKIRLIDKDITFQPPGYLATAEITVPTTTDGIWMADGTLYDSNKNNVGKLQFREIWRADSRLLSEMSALTWRVVFWGGLAVVLGIVFISQFNKSKAEGPSH